VLNYIVAELVIEKGFVILLDFVKGTTLLWFMTVFQYPLQHSTAVRVTRKRTNIVQNIIDDKVNLPLKKLGLAFVSAELCFRRLFTHDFDALLNDMVPILIMNAAKYIVVELTE
jgi:hypothetical protein